MSRKLEIEQILSKSLLPELLDVIDKTPEHHGHGNFTASGETHFKVIIRSKLLDGLNTIEQHRKIYELLNDMFSSGLHSLEIYVKT
jgi:BolA protein